MTTDSALPKVSIIIPVLHLQRPLNKKRFFMPRYTLREVLDDIRGHVRIPHEVVVVCNGDSPELVEFVKTSPVIDKYCVNNRNAGVARSWNMGAQLAEGETLLFLNDDVSVGEGAVEGLYAAAAGKPEVGVVGPVGAKWNGAEHESFVESDQVAEADMIAGFCFLVGTGVFHALGGFDIAYTPAGMEEIDFCKTATSRGLRNLVVPGLAFHHYHHHGVSASRQTIRYLNSTVDSLDLHQRNKAYFLKKWNIAG